MIVMTLWQTLSIPWQAAFEEAWTAYLAGCLPIGAVVADDDGVILTRGRNRIGETYNELSHAELNALTAMDYRLHDEYTYTRNRCCIYTTMEPCPLCMGAIYMSGVRQVAYAARDPYAGSINLLGTTPYLSRKPIQVTPPQDQAVEAISIGWLLAATVQDFTTDNVVLNAFANIAPRAVELAQRLVQDAVLPKFRECRSDAETAFIATANQLGTISSDQHL